MICPELNNYAYLGAISPGTRCMLYGVTNQEDSDENKQSGIYINAPSNLNIGDHALCVINWRLSIKNRETIQIIHKFEEREPQRKAPSHPRTCYQESHQQYQD